MNNTDIFFGFEEYQKRYNAFIDQYLDTWKSIIQTSMEEKFKNKIMQPEYFGEFISKPKHIRVLETELVKIITEPFNPIVLFPRGSIRKYPLMFTEISLPSH